ncbi:MAG: glycosyltransferase [Acidobacteriaceae bacterium]
MLHLLLALGIFGLITSTVYSVLVVVGVRRFLREHQVLRAQQVLRDQQVISDQRGQSAAFLPPVSLLKPLHGAEPNLEAHLEGFFEQDYPSYEVLFCARHAKDAGLEIARGVAARHPLVPVRFVTSGEPLYPNAKVASLERMRHVASHDILLVSDSDVRVEPHYLRSVVAPFAAEEVGLVTCLYRGVAMSARVPEVGSRDLWSQLEGVGMSIEMTSGVLVAEMMEGMQFALGPTMAVRRRCVDEIGGFQVLGQYCADDFLLGNLVAANGHKVVLSSHVIDHIILNADFADSMQHQVRWMKSTRFSRPKGHFGTSLTFSTPFGLLALAAALLLHHPLLGAIALAWSVVNRMLMAAVVGAGVVGERTLLRTVLLYPLRDLMGFGFWLASYGSSHILWRGEMYELGPGGLMKSVNGTASGEESESVLTV